MPATNPIPLEGMLNCWNDPFDLPDLLVAISRSGRTGRLSFSNPEADKTIYVKNGKIVFAESSSDDDGLGQYLLRKGQISLDDFTRVSKLVSPRKRLGALLVAEGVLEPKDLAPAVVGQVRAVIRGLFRRAESWFAFKEGEWSRKESITLDLPVAQLVLDGVQWVDSWRRISKGLGALDSVYQVAGATEVEWSRLKLESGPSELLTLLSKPMRISDVCARATIDDFNACRYLWAFKSLEWIEPAELAEHAEIAEVAERAAPLPMAPVAPVPLPTAPSDLATPVMNLAPAPPIPQRLLETQVSAIKAPKAGRAARPPEPPIPQRLLETQVSAIKAPKARRAARPPEPPPRPLPSDLVHTQLAVDLPEPPPASPATTRPEIAPAPEPVPAPHHTQLYVGAEAAVTQPAPPTTAEMMEAILDGSGDAPSATYEIDERESPEVPEARSDSATQFFPAGTALAPRLSIEAREPHEQEMPLIEATVVEDMRPVPSAMATTAPSIPASPAGIGGMEFFVDDPFQAPDAVAPKPTAFATDNPLQYEEKSVAASLPTRPRTEELDLDLEQFFAGDEDK